MIDGKEFKDMARSYDGTEDNSVRAEIEKDRLSAKDRGKKIELCIIICAVAVAVLSVVVNTGKCIRSASEAADYRTQQADAEVSLEELNAKLQDPAMQNYVYTDPVVGNMSGSGREIAAMQNQIIELNAQRNGLSGNSIHGSSSSRTGGAVTLDPEDMAPSGADVPDADTVEQNEATITPGESVSSESGYEYTPITGFGGMDDTQQYTQTDTETDAGSDVDSSVFEGRDLSQLIIDFKQNYFAQQVTNVDSVPGTQNVAWSWYGTWEFSGTYDYSVNEVPSMNAVWTCYDPYDTLHQKPIAFVTATYTQSTGKFTNPRAVYTQYYVNAASGQKNVFSGNGSDSSPGNTGTLSPGSPNGGMNGQGSENEYNMNIRGDGEDNRNQGYIDSDNITLEPDTENEGASGNTNSSGTGNISQPSNPNGTGTWTPGGGSVGSSGTGTWNPNGSGQGTDPGTWNPGGTGLTGGTGFWNPAN